VDEMLAELRTRWDTSPRDPNAIMAAQRLATRLPLVHRTGRLGRLPWTIFTNQRLDGDTPGTRFERETLGIASAVYFFWGCGAYPHGTVALLLDGVPASPHSTATPFDSGGCEANLCVRDGGELDEQQRAELLARYWLDDGTCVAEYGAAYVADIFDDPRDYVRRAQISDPDRSPIHGLRDRSGDRRAWTIEVQFQGDVPIPPECLRKIVLRQREQFRELPQPYRRLAVVPDIGDFSQAIAQEVLA
jgi:hypothetical protein